MQVSPAGKCRGRLYRLAGRQRRQLRGGIVLGHVVGLEPRGHHETQARPGKVLNVLAAQPPALAQDNLAGLDAVRQHGARASSSAKRSKCITGPAWRRSIFYIAIVAPPGEGPTGRLSSRSRASDRSRCKVAVIGVERSAASSARGAARLIGPGLVLSLALVPLTWWLPLFDARVPFLWRQQVSIASGLADLWRLDPLLCAVVFLFSVLTPLAKAAALVGVWYQPPLANARRQLDRLAILGKLAMTEVFLLAVVIVGIKGVGIGTVEIAWGLHAFVVIVVLSLAVSTWAWAALGRAVTEPPAIRP